MDEFFQEVDISEVGKALAAKRWAGHKKLTPEEKKERSRINQKNYRERKKKEGK